MGQVAVTHNRLYDNALAVQRRQDLRRMARSALTCLPVYRPDTQTHLQLYGIQCRTACE